MQFYHSTQFNKRKKADVLVLPYWKGKQRTVLPAFESLKIKESILSEVLATHDFKGEVGEVLIFYVAGEVESRFCLIGLGSKESVTVEMLRRSFGALTKKCLARHLKKINLLIPQQMVISQECMLKGIAEGLLLPNYSFRKYKSYHKESEIFSPLESVNWIGSLKNVLNSVLPIAQIGEVVNYARDLINGNADEVTPHYLTQCAREIARAHPTVKTVILDKKQLIKEKMGLLLAVSRGSDVDPVMIILEYRGNPKSKDKTVLVGKGVTYDTGGLNLKPTGSMETMKCDMSGAAVCLGTILAASKLKLKVNFTVVIPSTENAVDAKSYKPGDVYRSYSGKTVEMMNSDAEGRLILADALSYSIKHLQPSRIIDIATLTGAIDIALGSEAAGLMSTDDALAEALMQAGSETNERLWRMPLFEEYKERLKSDIADIKSWNGRSAGSNVAATFLRYFVDESIPWAHIDIASTAYLSESKKYTPKYATGYGVRLILRFLQNQVA